MTVTSNIQCPAEQTEPCVGPGILRKISWSERPHQLIDQLILFYASNWQTSFSRGALLTVGCFCLPILLASYLSHFASHLQPSSSFNFFHWCSLCFLPLEKNIAPNITNVKRWDKRMQPPALPNKQCTLTKALPPSLHGKWWTIR